MTEINTNSNGGIEIGEFRISPIVVSTILGHSGAGMFPLTLLPGYRRFRKVVHIKGVTVIAKSATFRPHKGNYRLSRPWTWRYIQPLGKGSMVNAYGLTNDGVRVHAEEIARACESGFQVIPSYYPQFSRGLDQAIQDALQAFEVYKRVLVRFFLALEFCFSCPNAESIRENMANILALIRAVREKYPEIVLIGKISVVHPFSFVQDLIGAGVRVIHGVNSIPWNIIFPGIPSPLAKVGGGGVSGDDAFARALDYNTELRQRIPGVPLIMGCGVTLLCDARQYFGVGANCVSVCTVCRRNPDVAMRIINEYA